MTIAHVYRITFKQRNYTVTIKQVKITHNEKREQTKKIILWLTAVSALETRTLKTSAIELKL